MCKCFQTEQEKIREKVWNWFDSQFTELEKDKKQNVTKMLGDWVLIGKNKKNKFGDKWHPKIAINLLKQQKQRIEEKFIRNGWHCGAEFKRTWEYYPFHAEETDNFLALCWVRHIVKTLEKIMGERNEKV